MSNIDLTQLQQTVSNAIDVVYTKLYNDCLASLDSGYEFVFKYNTSTPPTIPIFNDDNELNYLSVTDLHNGLIQYQDKMVHVLSTHELFGRLLNDLPSGFKNLILRKHSYNTDTIRFSICNEFEKWPSVDDAAAYCNSLNKHTHNHTHNHTHTHYHY